MTHKKVTIVGSGNWGSAIARIVGQTTQQNPDIFDKTVRMWVFEEIVNGEKLSEIINTRHENVRYLPGKILPSNVVAVPDLLEAAKDADILIFVIPHQFVEKVCAQLKGNIKPDAEVVSLIKKPKRIRPIFEQFSDERTECQPWRETENLKKFVGS